MCVSMREYEYTNMAILAMLERRDEKNKDSFNDQSNAEVHQSIVSATWYYAHTRKYITTVWQSDGMWMLVF